MFSEKASMAMLKRVLIVFLFLISTYSVNGTLTDSLHKTWEFEDVSSNVIDSHKTNTGTLSNTTLQEGSDCIVGKCISFDGANHVTDPFLMTSYGTSAEFSACMWVKTSDTSSYIWGNNDFVQIITTGGGVLTRSYGGAGITFGTGNNNSWHHFCFGYNATLGAWAVMDKGTRQTYASSNTNADNNVKLGKRGTDNGGYFTGLIDQLSQWNKTLDMTEITRLYDTENAGYGYPWSTTSFTATMINGTAISNFDVEVNLVGNYSSSGGVIEILGLDNTTYYDFTFSSVGFHNVSINRLGKQNTSVIQFEPLYTWKSNYSEYENFGGDLISNNITFGFNISCPDFSKTNAVIYIDEVFNNSVNMTCDNSSHRYNYSYQHNLEGSVNIALELNTTYQAAANNVNLTLLDVVYDLYPPVTIVNSSLTGGFANTLLSASLKCRDNIFSSLAYNLSVNGTSLYTGNLTNNTLRNETGVTIDGLNVVQGYCCDAFSCGQDQSNITIFSKALYLIDEKSAALFDTQNLTNITLYFDDNSSSYDVRTNGNNIINFTSSNLTRLRFEFEYESGLIIDKWVDISLISGSAVRVCANTDPTTFYEQYLISASIKEALVKNIFANCYSAADSTRFVYQEGYILKAYTIPALYSLSTITSGNEVILTSIDGSIETSIQLDSLEYNVQGYDFSIISDALTSEKTGDQEMTIYYKNLDEDNTGVSVVIERLRPNSVVYSSSSFANLDNITIVFNWAALTNITNESVFRITLDAVSGDDNSTHVLYFSTSGNTGFIDSRISIIIAALLTLFGLTFAVTRLTFSWFGIFIELASIIILALSVSAWYTLFFQIVNGIIIVYIILILINKNYAMVS